jgi:hypothetical protein
MSRRSTIPHALTPLGNRLRAQRLIEDLIWGLAIGSSGALMMALLAARLGGTPWESVIGAGLALFVIVALVRAFRRRNRPLDAARVARIVERRSGLQERLSTAVEHAERHGIVVDALQADAEAHLERLDHATVAPWHAPRLPMVGLLVAMTAWIAFGVMSLAPFQRPAANVWTESPSAATLHELAAEVEADAATLRRADLDEIATGLRELADSLSSPAAGERHQDRLESLLTAVAGAYGESVRPEQVLERLLQRDAQRVATSNEGEGAGTAHPTETAAWEAESTTLLPPGSSPTPLGSNEQIFSRYEEWIDDEDLDAQFAASVPGSLAERVHAPVQSEEAADMPSTPDGDGTSPGGVLAEIIGPSTESQAGESLLAGHGSQALSGEAADADFTDVGVEAMALVGRERDDGRRIEVELPPEIGGGSYDSTGFTAGTWRPQPEAPVVSDPTPFRHREAAARYYLPSQETVRGR